MGIQQTTALDYRIVDGCETVQYTAVRDGGNTVFTVNFADPQEYTLRELLASEGFFQAGDLRWGLGSLEFPVGIAPQRGDQVLRADGTTWELIAEPARDPFLVSWFCPSRKAR